MMSSLDPKPARELKILLKAFPADLGDKNHIQLIKYLFVQLCKADKTIDSLRCELKNFKRSKDASAGSPPQTKTATRSSRARTKSTTQRIIPSKKHEFGQYEALLRNPDYMPSFISEANSTLDEFEIIQMRPETTEPRNALEAVEMMDRALTCFEKKTPSYQDEPILSYKNAKVFTKLFGVRDPCVQPQQIYKGLQELDKSHITQEQAEAIKEFYEDDDCNPRRLNCQMGNGAAVYNYMKGLWFFYKYTERPIDL